MRVFSFFGHSNTGKTYVLEKISQRLIDENYKVGYLKLTRHQGPFDREGKDTHRISLKGAKRIGLLYKEGSVLWSYRKQDEIVFVKRHFMEVDFLLIEGNTTMSVPKIQCIKDKTEKVDNDPLLFYTCSLNDEGDLHIDRDFDKIYKIVKENAMPLLPHLDCGECGYKTCREFAVSYLAGKVKLKDCKILSLNAVSVLIDGKRIEMKPFVQDFLGNTILGALSSLYGFEEGEKISIMIHVRSLKGLKRNSH